MNEGWIKLHRKILNNDSLFRAASTFPLWCLLLLLADRNGKIVTGRFQLSMWLKMNPSTVYKALKRLQSLTMIDLKSNNKVTTITILNWGVYQQQSNNKVTAVEQQSNTYTRIENKNKELRIDDDIQQPQKISNRINLSKGQSMAFLKEFQGMTSSELKEQVVKCNDYMNMSSENYANPGLFLRKWLTRYRKEKLEKDSKLSTMEKIESHLPKISEEERQENLAKLAEMKKSLKLGGMH